LHDAFSEHRLIVHEERLLNLLLGPPGDADPHDVRVT
jgi:hypothetical protein